MLAFFCIACNKDTPGNASSEENIVFTGDLGEESDIYYVSPEGTEMTITGYPGFVLMHMAPGTKLKNVKKAVSDADGTIVSQMPGNGLYLVQMEAGQENAFISRLRSFKACQTIFPLIRIDGDSAYYVDWGDHALNVAFQLGSDLETVYEEVPSNNKSEDRSLESISRTLATALSKGDCDIVNISSGPPYSDVKGEHYGADGTKNAVYLEKMRAWYNLIGDVIRGSGDTPAPVVITAGNQFMHEFEFIVNLLSPETKELLNSRLFIVSAEQKEEVPYSNSVSAINGRIPGVITVNIDGVTNHKGKHDAGTSLAAPRFVRYVCQLVEASKRSGHPLSFQEAAAFISDEWRKSDLSSITGYFINGLLSEYNQSVGYEVAVDLGLSVKWASVNVGASRIDEFGDYFAWGETTPKTSFTRYNYKFLALTADGQWFSGQYTKYNPEDQKTVLDPEDDAASANWGGAWRMPSLEEWNELLNADNCRWVKAEINGVKGYLVFSKKAGYTDNTIFLPGAGTYGTSVDVIGSGHYLSSALEAYQRELEPYERYPYDNAQYLYFGGSWFGMVPFYRYFGRSVRPVCP